MIKGIEGSPPGFQSIGLAIFLSLISALTVLESIGPLKLPLMVALLVAIGLYLYTWHFRIFIACVGLLIPLSVPVSYSGNVIHLPSEILMISLGIIFLLRCLFKSLPPREFILQPITLLIIADLGWTIFTTFFSTMPEVSAKRLAFKSLNIFAFYFFLADTFRNRSMAIYFFTAYSVGMIAAVANTLLNHAEFAFRLTAAYFVTQPFYHEHTIYAACLTMLLLFVLVRLIEGWRELGIVNKISFASLAIIFATALFLSYSRAAWISLLLAFFLWAVLRIRPSKVLMATVFLVIIFVISLKLDDISEVVERNRAVSSKTDLKEHVMSLTNISNDASNAERLNRWYTAIEMTKSRPLMGFGPGTYQFKYGSFQDGYYMTRISTFDGDKGNAHSEYLNAMAENGIPALVILLLILGSAIGFSWKTWKHTEGRIERILITFAMIALASYYLHGFVNCFIDSDKAAPLVYACLAIIALISSQRKTGITGALTSEG